MEDLKHLDAMVFSVANYYVAVGHDCDAFESFEFCISWAPGTEGSQESAIGVEYLNPVVARIGYADVTLVVNGHAPENGK